MSISEKYYKRSPEDLLFSWKQLLLPLNALLTFDLIEFYCLKNDHRRNVDFQQERFNIS